MKRVWGLSAVLLLGGCSHAAAPPVPVPVPAPVPVAPVAPPVGMFKVVESPELATYFAANSLSLYQNNPQLRQFYLVNNYAKPTQLSGKPPINSSRATRVINCERDETAQFGRVYFSEPFAQGVEVLRKEDVAQWAAFPRQSMLGELRTVVCGIDAARLKAPPFKGPAH